ncbi:hypothetical protein BSLG_004976 [Batrachochytrium salamandrivorans]|nr:hypothetical protein BSLG_004976 [Batrachochytrium salamandrivorans]
MIPCGQEADGLPLYIARGWIEGGVHIGKASGLMWDGARISYKGKERIVRDYEILVGAQTAVHWVDTCNDFDPQSIGFVVLEGGREAAGSPLFIARAHVKGGSHIGKCART